MYIKIFWKAKNFDEAFVFHESTQYNQVYCHEKTTCFEKDFQSETTFFEKDINVP